MEKLYLISMISDTIHEHLRDLYSTKLGPLVEEATLIEPTLSVSQVIANLTNKNTYDAFYYDGKSVLAINLRELLAGKDIADMKVSSFLQVIPSLKENDTLQKAANIMTHYRIRSVPIIENGAIKGVINAKKILELLSKKDNKWIKANIILTKNPITISSSDSLSTARRIMSTKRIDHLPVTNKGTIRQVLTSFHVVQGIVPHEGVGRKSIGMNKIRNLESPIGNIGSTRIPQCSPHDDLNSILNAMLRTDTTCCLVNLWDNLQGIITYRDILGLLAMQIESEVPLYIVGLPEDQKNVDLISSKFTNTLKRIRNVYSDIQEARITIKQQRTGGKKRGNYEVSIIITTPHRSPLIYKEVGFDLSKLIEALSQKLLRNLSKRAKRRNKTSIRKIGLPVSKL